MSLHNRIRNEGGGDLFATEPAAIESLDRLLG